MPVKIIQIGPIKSRYKIRGRKRQMVKLNFSNFDEFADYFMNFMDSDESMQTHEKIELLNILNNYYYERVAKK